MFGHESNGGRGGTQQMLGCDPGTQTLILFTTQISDFPISLRQNSDFSDTVYHTLSAARLR